MSQEGTNAVSRPTLDSLTSLRLFAALAVVGFHRELLLVVLLPDDRTLGRAVYAGPTGVSFFFILSGFVLAWSARTDDTAGAFVRRRAARIVPNHVLTWTVALVVIVRLYQPPRLRDGISSLFLLNSWYPSPSAFNAVNTPSWSLCCEAFFYALFPATYWWINRAGRASRRRVVVASLAAIGTIAAVSPAIDGYLTPGADEFFVYHFPLSRLLEFIIGIVLAFEVRDGRWPVMPLWPNVVATVAALGIVDVLHEQRFYVVITVVPFAALIASAAARDVRGLDGVLRSPWLIRGGQWSFALYLVHWPILLLVAHYVHPPIGAAAGLLLALAAIVASCAAAAATFAFWERPLERRLRANHQLPAVNHPDSENSETIVG